MNPLIWLTRAKRWAQNPPSANKVKFVFAIIVVCLLLYLIEKAGLWPDWATAQKLRW